MKRLVYILLLIWVAITITAQVQWGEQKHFFGLIDEANGEVSHEFSVVNNSLDPMAIIHVQKSCGCTSVDYPKEAIAPGDTALLHVVFDPTGYIGRFNKNVYVKIAVGDTAARAILTVAGTIKASYITLTNRFTGEYGAIRMKKRSFELEPTADRQSFPAYNNSADTLNFSINAPEYLKVRISPAEVPPYETFYFVFNADLENLPEQKNIGDSITVSYTDQNYKIPFLLFVGSVHPSVVTH